MKIKPGFFVVTFLIVSVVCSSTVITSYARELVDRWEQLKEHIGTAEALAETDPQLSHFIGEVMPELINIDKEFLIQEELEPQEKIEDVMVFAYETARERLFATKRIQIPIGYWSTPPISPEVMRKEAIVVAIIVCRIKEFFNLRKPKEYEEKMAEARLVLYDGAYNSLIARLSLRDPLFTTPTETLADEGKLPHIEELINLKAVKMLKEVKCK